MSYLQLTALLLFCYMICSIISLDLSGEFLTDITLSRTSSSYNIKAEIEYGENMDTLSVDCYAFQDNTGDISFNRERFSDVNIINGGIATNIGVHVFDMLGWVFGGLKENVVHLHTHDRAAGLLHFEEAKVRWFVSINYDTLPEEIKAKGMRS